MNALDWLYELFWTECKIQPATHIMSPDDPCPDPGPG